MEKPRNIGFMVQTTVGSCETNKHSNAISGVIFVDAPRPSLTPPVLHRALNSPVDWMGDSLAGGYIGPSTYIPTVTGVMRVRESDHIGCRMQGLHPPGGHAGRKSGPPKTPG